MKVHLKKVFRGLILSLLMIIVGGLSLSNAQEAEKTQVKIYYDREDTSNWDVWLWADGVEPRAYPFNKVDSRGKYADILIDKPVNSVSYIVRKSDWSDREPSENEDGSRTLLIEDSYGEAYVSSKNEKIEETKPSQKQEARKLRIHFDTFDTNYSIWAWTDGIEGSNHEFTGADDYGPYVDLEFDGDTSKVGFLVRDPDWNKDVAEDRFVDLNTTSEIYLKSKDPKIYFERPVKEEEKRPDKKLVNLTIHYDGDKDDWSLWMWPKDGQGKEYFFNSQDKNGKVAEVDIETDKDQIGFLVKDSNWNKDIGEDRYIDLSIGREIWLKSGDPKIYYENPYEEERFYDSLKANIHYRRYDPNDGNWFVKAYTDDQTDSKLYPLKSDGRYLNASISCEGENLSNIYFKLVNLDENGNELYSDGDYKLIKKFDENGNSEVYILQDNQRVYYDKTIVDEDVKILKASIDSFRQINIKLNKALDIESLLKNGYEFISDSGLTKDDISYIGPKDSSKKVSREILVIFNKDLDLDKDYGFKFYLDKDHEKVLEAKAVMGHVVASKKFDEKYAYDGDLGPIYSEAQTTFKLWAPTASKVDLVVFTDAGEVIYPMQKNDKGVYSYILLGDKDKTVYMYDVHFKEGTVNRVVDPYSKSTTINGEKSVVVNPKISVVERPKSEFVKNPIIYELHVRDLSNQAQSGIKNRGKFLGLAEKGTKTPTGQKTGLDYIKDLGVSHIQLLPIYDYSKYSVDEEKPMEKYNWGYDPVNYNTPEGAYSTDPSDPYARINELQTAIDAIHKEDMGVIMDVVYNHVYSLNEHAFDKIVPGYYFRFDEDGNPHNGTGVGNETASERKMMSKYIIDSVKYWAKTYKIDGFRFDLMGVLDFETMNKLVRELKEINPDIVILGEGWNMGNHDEDIRAAQINAYKMPYVGMFNDDLRDGVKGSVFGGDAIGFVNDEKGVEEDLFKSIRTVKNISGKTYDNPQQLIQYTEAHDNKTSWDKIKEVHPDEDDKISLRRQRLATVIPLLSQGRPFIHAGQEFARTKGGNENSYNAPAEVNEMDWSRAEKLSDNVDYIKEVIKIRKNEPLFWLDEFYKVDSRIEKIKAEDGLIAFRLKEGDKEIIIGFNRDRKAKEFDVDNGSYKVLIRDDKAKASGIEDISIIGGKTSIEPLSTLMLVRKTQKDSLDEQESANEDQNNNDLANENNEGDGQVVPEKNPQDNDIFDMKNLAAMYPAKVLGEKILVEDINLLTDKEKEEILEAYKKLNPHAKSIEFDKDGNLLLTYEDGSENVLKLGDLVEEKLAGKNDPEKETKDKEVKDDKKTENEKIKDQNKEEENHSNKVESDKLKDEEKTKPAKESIKEEKAQAKENNYKKARANVKTGIASLKGLVLLGGLAGLCLIKLKKK